MTTNIDVCDRCVVSGVRYMWVRFESGAAWRFSDDGCGEWSYEADNGREPTAEEIDTSDQWTNADLAAAWAAGPCHVRDDSAVE